MTKKTFGFGPSKFQVGDDVVVTRGESRRSEMKGPAGSGYEGPLAGARCKVVRSDVEEPLAIDGGNARRRVTVVPVEGGRDGTPTGLLSLPVDYVRKSRTSSRSDRAPRSSGRVVSRPYSEEARRNYDRVFGRRKTEGLR